MSPSLSVVSERDVKTATPKAETLAQRVGRLQLEAKSLARDHIRALEQALHDVEQIAAEIAAGGDAYPPGARDLARRLANDAESRAQTLEAIRTRTSS